VGAIPGCHFNVQTVQLDPGEMLFAFTDGAPEAKDPRGEFFGHERLLQALRRYGRSSHELVRAIEAELNGYMDGTTQFDDITLLAVRRVQ
jgi:serine phosphatase RsbU (regulator of sigma subunit)